MIPAASTKNLLRRPAAWLGLGLLALCGPLGAAPSEGTAGQTVTGRSVHRPGVAAAPASQSKPAWKDLTSTQQQALLPLAPHWSGLSEERKLKWLVISKNFDRLPPEEQAKMHRRMSRWVTLSQQQRTQARQNYKEIKTLTPEQKASEWEAYQALSVEEKRKLAAQAGPKPAGLTAVKPAKAPKLSKVPAPRGAVSGARMADAISPIQHNTLLPRQEPARSEPENSPYEDDPADTQ